jgi:hypothetical protein
LQKEANKLWDEGPVNYVEKWAKNLDTKDVVSGAIGGVTSLLGVPMLPAWGIGKIGEMLMSEGHGQIGMPGTVMSDYYGDNRGTETISTVHGFADVPGVGVVAVDAQGRPLGGTGPQAGVYSYAFPGAGATTAGQAAYETGLSTQHINNIMQDYTQQIDTDHSVGDDGWDADGYGPDQGLEE